MKKKTEQQPVEQLLTPTIDQQALDHDANQKAMEEAMLKRMRGAALANALRNWSKS